MNRGTSLALIAVLVVALVASVFIQVWVLPAEAASVGAAFPEVSLLVVPGITWGVLAIACWQVAAVFGLRVVVLARQHRFEVAHGWLLAMAGCLVAFLVLVVAAFIALSVMGYTTPGVMLGLIGGGLLALIAIGALGALARFLRAGASSPQYSHD
ncbi:DUF2975 domain-containing protein [Cryobacterium algoricola]|uniref:DUF2975 domain-containing protein n=2 Tax=Cryobacterium TaxID=69578 RepID=A0AA41UH56_9MICO|nr:MULTISPECIES: DUF2975 domain-containing protein [Cryobacterium]MCI4658029.1 DUF2975 domain-containing protein [Cryobacterium zhongshanensis]TFB86199.1 DUF2975 domain-containing protein [Cryobacterium algoricola]